MSKQMRCQTVICKVNGITLLDLKNINNGNENNVNTFTDKKSHPKNRINQQFIEDEEEDDDIVLIDESEDYNIEESQKSNELHKEFKPMIRRGRKGRKGRVLVKKGVYEMEKVETSIESVRQYIHTSRRNGKVWHQCRWSSSYRSSHFCNYGSKWSGAMVNHIRSHMGIKPFRCLYCNKLFTIACNLKNHLRIHHGLRAQIILNGGRRIKQMSLSDNSNIQSLSNVNQEYEEEEEIKSSKNAKLRIFKPSFINGNTDDSYAIQRRTLPKRTVKKNTKYTDYEEDFEDEEEMLRNNMINEEYNEEEAEEDNRKFYETTNETSFVEDNEEEEFVDDDASQFVVKRRYNKRLWFVCVWNPRHCKYRSALMNEVVNHVKKHQNINQMICNFNNCNASFASQIQLDTHQAIHRKQKFLQCNFENCGFQTINETALKLHKIRHKRQI